MIDSCPENFIVSFFIEIKIETEKIKPNFKYTEIAKFLRSTFIK